MRLRSRDYYDLLQVPRSANDAQIKRAYRKLALKLHPGETFHEVHLARQQRPLRLRQRRWQRQRWRQWQSPAVAPSRPIPPACATLNV